MLILASDNVIAVESELNTDFLQGVDGIPSIMRTDIEYPAGQYFVDVQLNSVTTGRRPLDVSLEDEKAGNICLSSEWLEQSGIHLRLEAYKKNFDNNRGCYVLGKNANTLVQFDYAAQTVNFIVPQAYILNENNPSQWDYGINGLKVTYDGNFDKSSDDTLNAFGHFNTTLNVGRWVLSSNMNATKDSYGSQLATNDLTLSTAISQIRGDFQLGRSQTRSELFPDFGFYGVSLRSNSNMRPRDSSGYAPLISGVATSTSRITISQGGYTIYSKVVPPGPYQIDDISPVSNGDLLVIVEDDSGTKKSTIYPVSTLPTLLRPGEYNYDFAVGQKNEGNELKDAFTSSQGTFLLGSLDYGLSDTTINMATILHDHYQSGGFGFIQSLGKWGAFSSNANLAKAEYDNNKSKHGISFTFKYAKNFTNKTDLQLLTYRYQSSDYRDFSSFTPDSRFDTNPEKVRYEARLSHRLNSDLYLSSSFWRQSYWNNDGDSAGIDISISKSMVNGISIYGSGSYSHGGDINKDDYSASIGASIPFNLGGVQHYNNISTGYNRGEGTSFNTGISATIDKRLNYNLNINKNAQDITGSSANIGYAFDTVQTNLGVSQNGARTTFSGGASGSAVITAESGLLLTKQSSDTLAIVKIRDMPGVTFNESLPTNDNGETAVFLPSYNLTNININTDNVPDNIDLLNSSYNVTPTEKAIVYREFNFIDVQRYILRVRDSMGHILKGGNAKTDLGVNVGFISSNGVLLINLHDKTNFINIDKSNGQSCKINLSALRENTSSVQEVFCE